MGQNPQNNDIKRLNGIKNLLFDLGGVIMDIERERCVKSLVALGMSETTAENMLGLYVQSGPFLKLEEGLLSEEAFYDAMRNNFPDGGVNISNEHLKSALNDFLIGIPAHRLEALRRLRKDYKIYLLSNTNPIMYNSKIAECFRIEGHEMSDYFDGQVVSFKAKCAKPDRKIFEYTVEHLGIRPEETLFFDDSQKNLDAAAQLGFKTALVAPGTEFMEKMEKASVQ